MINTEYVKEMMAEKGWTIGQLSQRSGISKAQLSRILHNKRGAGARTVRGLIKAFPDADKEKLFFLD